VKIGATKNGGYVILRVNPVIDDRVRGLCTRPYPGAPRGCPNFGKKFGCPPHAPLFQNVFDLERPIYAVINIFDFEGHVARMKAKHPDWTDKQAGCSRYWQSTARKDHMEKIKEFLGEHQEYTVCTAWYKGAPPMKRILYSAPEAMGIDVTKTLRNAGIELEWPPKTVARQVALAGIRKDGKVGSDWKLHG
jgi:predicted metal-binding protein